MGRWPVSIAAAALALITACAASPGTAPARRGASREHLAERVVSHASYRPHGPHGARPVSRTLTLCGRAPSGAAPNGPGTTEMCLRVPVRVRQHGRTRIVYRLRPCWCYRDSGSGGG
jgi:hypothetical protein